MANSVSDNFFLSHSAMSYSVIDFLIPYCAVFWIKSLNFTHTKNKCAKCSKFPLTRKNFHWEIRFSNCPSDQFFFSNGLTPDPVQYGRNELKTNCWFVLYFNGCSLIIRYLWLFKVWSKQNLKRLKAFNKGFHSDSRPPTTFSDQIKIKTTIALTWVELPQTTICWFGSC